MRSAIYGSGPVVAPALFIGGGDTALSAELPTSVPPGKALDFGEFHPRRPRGVRSVEYIAVHLFRMARGVRGTGCQPAERDPGQLEFQRILRTLLTVLGVVPAGV